MTDPRWIEMERRAVELRRQGLTYEEIAKAVSGDRYAATPWWVYGQCNAEKTGAQIVAWRRKHHPESLESEDNA